MGFVAKPEAPAPGSPHLVQNDGWWPDVDLTLLRANQRVDSAITPERLRDAAVEAMRTANSEANPFKLRQMAAGFSNLAAVPGASIGGETVWLSTYRRAVQSLAAADLIDRYRDIAATRAGQDREEDTVITADEHRRNYRWAISDLLGVPRTTIELI